MARTAGRCIKCREYSVKVYMSSAKKTYLERLYRFKKLMKGKSGSYSMSNFLNEILSLYINANWEKIGKVRRTVKKDKGRSGEKKGRE